MRADGTEELTSTAGRIIGHRYKIVKSLGKGSYGEVFVAEDMLIKGMRVAVKLERSSAKCKLQKEHEVYKQLEGIDGIPNVHLYGEGPMYTFLVLDLLGPSLLRGPFKSFKCRVPAALVANWGQQMLKLVEYVHSKGYVHGDIKPSNFVTGVDNCSSKNIFLIDFGFSISYLDTETGLHVPFQEAQTLKGTPNFMSLHTHRRIRPTRRDDIESLGYTLLFLIKGTLPWHGVEGETKQEQREEVATMKAAMEIGDVCRDAPIELELFMKYCQGLQFQEKPDYAYLLQLLHTLGENQCGGQEEVI